MRLRNIKNAKEIVSNSPYVITPTKELMGKFKEIFNNNNPIYLEIGMGKGDFLIRMAEDNPKINFIGIEKYESVMVRAIQKLENKELPNLKLIRTDADIVNFIFKHEISLLFLNFSDPWPKTRHERRRLTSEIFLKRYDDIFIDNPKIIQKTDNIGLFAFSLSSLSKYGYTLEKVSLDLENEEIPNVETEYEKKFKSKGVKINYLEAVKYLEK